jgi:peptidoglycan/xylan/chitin deacetylase (PgdA/CDA1 family)
MIIYFKKPKHWNNVYIYYWNQSNTSENYWPGIKMNKINFLGWYYINFENIENINFLLNDGVKYQTMDFIANDNVWIENNSMWNYNPDILKILLFPEGKNKSLVMSYDDGSIQDKKLVKIFDKNSILGTFHINSGLMGYNNKISKEELKETYQNHEISAHSVTHPFLSNLIEQELEEEIFLDKKNLENIIDSNKNICGLSYPFGDFNNKLLDLLPKWGFKYGRTIANTNNFRIPNNLLLWDTTCHHNDARFLSDKFLNNNNELDLFLIWGHSWEFDGDHYNNWYYIEYLSEKLGNNKNIWYSKACDVAEYLNSLSKFEIGEDYIHNLSKKTFYIKNNPTSISFFKLKPNESKNYDIKKFL